MTMICARIGNDEVAKRMVRPPRLELVTPEAGLPPAARRSSLLDAFLKKHYPPTV
jgi:hypothetical protein